MAAVFLLDNHQRNTYTSTPTSPIDLTSVGFARGCRKARDIWAREENDRACETLVLTVPPWDSRFVLLTPE